MLDSRAGWSVVLVRRVYFQLLGLPPTSRQVTHFLEDTRPDALERLVDGLLASPQFGERWGRHWLDLPRYADSNGLDENFLFREAWRYRDWVIDGVNADMPFDRFVLEQVAGDLLPYDSIMQRDRQRTAAGFLVVGPKVLLGNDPQERRMDVADERIRLAGRFDRAGEQVPRGFLRVVADVRASIPARQSGRVEQPRALIRCIP